jgi:hypothetical protein
MTTMTQEQAQAWRAEVERRLAALEARPVASAAATLPAEGAVASDADLDGEHGDPLVRKDPPRWTGESYAEKHYSECSSAFLLCLAGFLDWCGENDATSDNEKYRKNARYKRLDAARARGWAKRNEGGVAASGGGEDPSLPF